MAEENITPGIKEVDSNPEEKPPYEAQTAFIVMVPRNRQPIVVGMMNEEICKIVNMKLDEMEPGDGLLFSAINELANYLSANVAADTMINKQVEFAKRMKKNEKLVQVPRGTH